MNKCEVCGQEYEYYQRVRLDMVHGKWQKSCEHDDARSSNLTYHGEIEGAHKRHNDLERSHYHADIVQPVKKDGRINKDFIKVHGTKQLQKEWKMSDREIRENAK